MDPARVAFALLLASTCLSCSSTSTSQTGIRLGDKTLEQFKQGETSEDWVVAVIGPPTSRTVVPGPQEIHILRYSTVERSTGLLDFFSGKSSRNTATIYFIVRDGMVTQFWADRETERTLFGKEVEKKSGEKEK